MTPPPGSVNARLQAAQGYLGLGMAMDAWAPALDHPELAAVIDCEDVD